MVSGENLTWRISLFLGRFYVSDVFRDLTYLNPDLAYSYFNLSEDESKFLSDFIPKNKLHLEDFAEDLIQKRRPAMNKFPITARIFGESKLFVFFKLYAGMFPKEYFLEETANDAISFGRFCEQIFSHYPNIHPVFSDLIRYERRFIKENVIRKQDATSSGAEVTSSPIECLFENPQQMRLVSQYKWMDWFDYDLVELIKSEKLPDTKAPTFLILDHSGRISKLTKDMHDLIFLLVESSNFLSAKDAIEKEFGLNDSLLKEQIEHLSKLNYITVRSKKDDFDV